MIRCVVVDDKPLAIDVLKNYIGRLPQLELTFSTTNPLEALNKVLDGGIDLIFLDIQMPELNGLQLMKIVKGKCLVILTTAYTEHALEGFENDVVDYLLKPISFERFCQAIEKVQVILKGLAGTNEPLAERPPPQKTQPYIFVKTEYKLIRVSIVDILYIEGMQNYVIIYTAQEKIISLQTMKKLEELLPSAQFVRVHKSFIVALDKINSIERHRIAVADIQITLGEVYRDAFYKAIN